MQRLNKLLIFVYFALLPFGQFVRLPLNWLSVNIYLTDIVVGILGILGILGRLGRPRLKLRPAKEKPPFTKPGIIFLVICFFSLLVNAPRLKIEEVLVAGLYLIRLIAYFGLYLVAYEYRRTIPYKKILMFAGLTVAVFGLFQYVIWPDTSGLKYLGWDDHYYRLIGTFLDPGFTGIILVLTLMLFTKSALFYWILPALLLTYSRASFLAFWVGLGLLGLSGKLDKKILTLTILTFLIFIIIPRKSGGEGVLLTRTSTIEARIGGWQNSWAIIKKNLVFGVGFNAYRYAQLKAGFLSDDWQTNHAAAGVDNSFLFTWATTGLFGLLGLMVLLGKMLQKSWGKSPVLFASLTAVVTHSLFSNTLFYPWIMGWLVFILASD
jgi:hypothetical protein